MGRVRDERKARKVRAPARIGAHFRSELGWLRGMPLGVSEGVIEWLVLPNEGQPAEVISVHARKLASAHRTLSDLTREHRAALARIVGDVSRWHACASSLLAQISTLLHGQSSLEQASERLCAEHSPALTKRIRSALFDAERSTVARALLWASALDPEALRARLDVAERDAQTLATIVATEDRRRAWAACWAYVCVTSEEPARAGPLRSLVGEVATTAGSIFERKTLLEALPLVVDAEAKSFVVRPPRPKRDTALGALVPFLEWLASIDAVTRRLALAYVAASVPVGLVSQWAEVERTLTRIDEKARTQSNWVASAPVVQRIRALTEQLPASWPFGEYLADLRRLCDARFQHLSPALLRLLPLLPGAPTARSRVLHHWAELCGELDAPTLRRAPIYLDAFARYAKASREHQEARLLPWRPLLFQPETAVRWWSGPDHDALGLLRQEGAVGRFFDALAQVAGPLSSTVVDVAAELTALGGVAPSAVAVRALQIDKQFDDYPSSDTLRAAHALQPGDDAEYVALVGGIMAVKREASHAHWVALEKLVARDDEGRALVRRALRKRRDWVERMMSLASLVGGAAERLPRSRAAELTSDTRWTRRFPETLLPALLRICRIDETAEAVAMRVLGRDFPSTTSIHRQIAAIEARGDALDEGLRERLQSLRRRLRAPFPPSRARLAHLATKLSQLADTLEEDQWATRLREAAGKKIARLLGLPECPDWALSDVNLRVLAGALELPSASRLLALRLFTRRAGPPPWDLRDAPENVAALATYAARGIDVRPWVDGLPPSVARLPDGTRVTIAFENDPLEIFMMGERFETCLSVGGANFFSVFANAADIDKRVAYARDAKGAVIARCLFALDDDGHILVFHTYAHRDVDFFCERFAELARTLAERMHTVCAATGTVVPRVASAWYDDGPRDIVRQFPFLSHGSPWRTVLAECPTSEVVNYVQTAFSPRPLDGLTLPLVLDLSVFNERPELSLPLLSLLEASQEPLSESLRVRAAELACAAQDVARARRLARGALEATLRRAFANQDGHIPQSAVDSQLAIDPARLALLARRAVRVRGVSGSHINQLRCIEASAIAKLGRGRRALALLRGIATSRAEALRKEISAALSASRAHPG